MRVKSSSDGLTLQAVAGTHVVLLGWDYSKSKCGALAGFAIHREDHIENEAGWLKGMKTFQLTDPGFPPGSLYSTRQHPIQSFGWSDYSAKPGYDYTYRVVALKGPPDNLSAAAEISVRIQTESPQGGLQDIHFNRGITASQEFARRFGDINLKEIDTANPVWKWLSRGLFEAMVEFVNAAQPGDKLRICAYEFHFAEFLDVVRQAVERGVDVKIIYDAKEKASQKSGVFPRDANRLAVEAAGLEAHCIERAAFKSAISHNKFIVRFSGNTPVSVWTGGTNFSDGGIFGQSNVGEVCEIENVAAQYANYWELLSKDPTGRKLRPKVGNITPTPEGLPEKGVSVIFSPRPSLDILQWYAERAKGAQNALFMTFAFGIHDIFKDVFKTANAPLRFAVMEKPVRPMANGPKKDAELEAIRQLRFMGENIFAIGSYFKSNRFDNWVAERLTGLNSHVRFIHNKFMIIDPLSEDPIVIGGSANFSAASVQKNDENMLITRGNKRVADIYLGEFMRLFRHHAFREWANRNKGVRKNFNHLRTDDWWRDYFGKNDRSERRKYFAGV